MWKRIQERRAVRRERRAVRAERIDRRYERMRNAEREEAELRAQQLAMQNDPVCVQELQQMMRICTLVGRAALPLSTIPAEKHPAIVRMFDDYDRATVTMVFSKKFPMTHAVNTWCDLPRGRSAPYADDPSKMVSKVLWVLVDTGMILRPYKYDPTRVGLRESYISELLAWYHTNFGSDGIAKALGIELGDVHQLRAELAKRVQARIPDIWLGR